MKTYSSKLFSLIAIFASDLLYAQSISNRQKLQETWVDDQRSNRTFYQSAPVTQVVPTFNTITYAGQVEFIDATITPSEADASSIYEESLKLNGYTVSPHLAISLKRIGLGFSGEAGQRTARYSLSPITLSNGYYNIQSSKLDYRGFGFYVYWIMPQPFGKRVKPTLTLGNSAYAAQHQVSRIKSGNSEPTLEDDDYEKFNYNVSKNQVGLNVGIQLLKKFSLIPWSNFEWIDTSDAAKRADEGDLAYKQEFTDVLRDDVELFWHARPRLQYGLDFSVRLFNSLEVHLGGFLGQIAALGPKNEQIKDRSFVVSVAFDQKGN